MASPSAAEVAGSFAKTFFDTLVSEPDSLVQMYNAHSSFNVVDMEHGQRVAKGDEIPLVLQQWANVVADSDITIESVSASDVQYGVSSFINWTATSTTRQQFFHMLTVLEAYGPAGYYVRHQTVIRQAVIHTDPPKEEAVPEPEPVAEVPEPVVAAAAPVPEPVEEAAPAPVPAAHEVAHTKKSKAPKHVEVAESEPAAAPVQEEAPVEAEKTAAPPAPSKPKSWATLARTAPAPHTSIKVLNVTSSVKKPEVKPAEVAAPVPAAKGPRAGAGRSSPSGAEGEKRGAPRHQRDPQQPVGDRIMFKVTNPVTEEEVRATFTEFTESIVSVRFNHSHDLVFMDFVEGAVVFEDPRTKNFTIGGAKEKVSLRRQHDRE